MEITVPFLKRSIGAGDLVKKAASALGIEQKPGCGCAKRQAALNRGLTFRGVQPQAPTIVQQPAAPAILRPRKTLASVGKDWTVPPFAPEGWELVDECEHQGHTTAMMLQRGTCFIIWSVAGGQYRNSHTQCVGGRPAADKRFSERCLQLSSR